MPVLMKHVAEAAGVSAATVSQVLSGNPTVSIPETTRNRVLDAARKLNYYPNPHAKRLAQRASNTYGLIISEIANPFFTEVIHAFEAAAHSRGCELLLCNTEYDHDRTRNAVNKLVASRVRGVALATSSLDPALLDPFVSHGIPVVALSRKLARTGGGYLNVDVKTGLESAVAHLLDLGHRSFAAITGPLSVPSARNYAEVLRSVMTEHGLPPCEFLECNYRHEGGMMAVRSLMLRPQLPTAVLCGNDLVALGAISALEQLGVDVPKSVSVVGFDDILFARLARPPLTTVAVPCAEIGRLALETLASPGGRRLRPVAVPTKLVVRSSTAPPRSTGRAPRRAG